MKTFYDILEIEITKDSKIVKKAYSKMVKRFGPEDNPNEFERIRNAYEKILEFISKVDTKELPYNTVQTEISLTEKYIKLAQDFENQKQFDKAILAYEKVLKIECDSGVYKNRLQIINSIGIIYTKKKEFNKAIEKFNEILDINNETDTVYSNLAYTYKELGDYERAIENYIRAYDLNKENSSYIKCILDINILKNEIDKLLENIKKYDLKKEEYIKYYIMVLNKCIKDYIGAGTESKKEQSEKGINEILALIYENYSKTDESITITRKLLSTITELYNKKYYDLSEKVVKVAIKINKMKELVDLESSILNKKLENELINQVNKIQTDSRLNPNLVKLVLYLQNEQNSEITSHLVSEVYDMNYKDLLSEVQVMNIEYMHLYKKSIDILGEIIKRKKRDTEKNILIYIITIAIGLVGTLCLIKMI